MREQDFPEREPVMSFSIAVAAKPSQAAQGARISWADSPANHERLELSGTVMRFAADRQIYAEGDEARSFYKVVSGVVRTCRFLNDGRRQIDAFHNEGDVVVFEAHVYHRPTA